MNDSVRDLYAGYVRAVEFFNRLIEKKYASDDVRAVFYQQPVSEAAFPDWWDTISTDPQLTRRWLERFADPAGDFDRACRQISAELDRIPIQKGAA